MERHSPKVKSIYGPSESQIQRSAMAEIFILQKQYPDYLSIASVPNGARVSPRHAKRLKDEGLSSGYPDILVDLPRHGFHGLRIEVKKPGGRPSPTQREWKARLEANAYAHAYCYSVEDILRVIGVYIFGTYREGFLLALERHGLERTRGGKINQSARLSPSASRSPKL